MKTTVNRDVSRLFHPVSCQEVRPGDSGNSNAPLQLLLPDLRFDVARALLEFLYTGELRRTLDLNSPLPYDLRVAAKAYGVPRLEALCTEAISLGFDAVMGGERNQVMRIEATSTLIGQRHVLEWFWTSRLI